MPPTQVLELRARYFIIISAGFIDRREFLQIRCSAVVTQPEGNKLIKISLSVDSDTSHVGGRASMAGLEEF
jgi:hypothetical protein